MLVTLLIYAPQRKIIQISNTINCCISEQHLAMCFISEQIRVFMNKSMSMTQKYLFIWMPVNYQAKQLWWFIILHKLWIVLKMSTGVAYAITMKHYYLFKIGNSLEVALWVVCTNIFSSINLPIVAYWHDHNGGNSRIFMLYSYCEYSVVDYTHNALLLQWNRIRSIEFIPFSCSGLHTLIHNSLDFSTNIV